MKSWTLPGAALAFTLSLAAPAVAYSDVTPWADVQENPGTNCTIGRAVINNTTGNAGSTVRSKSYCSEFASDVNLPADRMGAAAVGQDTSGYACTATGVYADNAASTAVKSVTNTVYCTGLVEAWGYQRRKINATDWVYRVEITIPIYF